MEKKEKEAYVKHWSCYISQVNVLGMCNNKALSGKVFSLVKELQALVPKIADDKIEYTKQQGKAKWK